MYCNECQKETSHKVISEKLVDWCEDSWQENGENHDTWHFDRYTVLKCLACHKVSLKIEHWSDESYDPEDGYYVETEIISKPEQEIFFDGQVFDAHKFVSDIIRSAEKSIILIDNYVDDTVLTLFSKRKHGVTLKILTKNISKQLQLDIQKFNEQFPPAEIQKFNHSHDRFMIIDDRDLHHFGSSLKDLGKKWFGFSKMDFNLFSEFINELKKFN